MTGSPTRTALMLEVLREVARAGLKPLLWHLDDPGLQSLRDGGTGTHDRLAAFMDVPIDPVAKCVGGWTLDVASGITIQGHWPEAEASDADTSTGTQRSALTLH